MVILEKIGIVRIHFERFNLRFKICFLEFSTWNQLENRSAFQRAKAFVVSTKDVQVESWMSDAENSVEVPYHPNGGFAKVQLEFNLKVES